MIRSDRLRLPSSIILLMKRATFLFLYLASGTSNRRTTFLRLGKFCLLCIPFGSGYFSPALFSETWIRWCLAYMPLVYFLVTDTRKGVDSTRKVRPSRVSSDAYTPCNMLLPATESIITDYCL